MDSAEDWRRNPSGDSSRVANYLSQEEVKCYHGEAILAVWPYVWDRILRALQRSDQMLMLGTIREDLIESRSQLWCFGSPVSAIVIGRVRVFEDYRGYELYVVEGEQTEPWTDRVAILEDYAKHHDCRELYISGRPGWARVFKDQGYATKYVVVAKEL